MIVYKIDVLAALKNVGYSTYKLRKDKILGEATIQAIRTGQQVTWDKLSILCQLWKCQAGDLLEFVDSNTQND